ncbi:excinuclease ABC subunit UvrA [Gloeobacter morelensis]|uniref:UvrABC system protein A n=1 Tax=Gloeobacter morelensis MG652769 TaxID=2781736 RepID=A0ABY3PGI3_9CYAN|nr:excinuclease ABC subunit UvrA [Gloeobacter morelensis]UFP92760.1 excinuclease ABC subunit UvrA [Gloeobacter morelensis MG652769]
MMNGNGGKDCIHIQGARQHNLKNISLKIPRNQLVVITGVSGSGKSSLAFDTIFAEGQRRYVESLSAYARQFLGQLDKPDVDHIDGLSPAISIDQKSTSHNPRSTVGTVTEIYDYLRLLFGRAGKPFCPVCGLPIEPQTIEQIVDRVLELPEGTRFQLLAPVVRGKKGTHAKLLSALASEGFVRVRVDGRVHELSEKIDLEKNQSHTVEIVVDRLVRREGIAERLADSLATALERAEGTVVVELLPRDDEERARLVEISRRHGLHDSESEVGIEMVFSANYACPVHGSVMEELSPRMFSFNSPYGACPSCHGLGAIQEFSPDLVVPDPAKPVSEAVLPWAESSNPYYGELLKSLGKQLGFSPASAWHLLTSTQRQTILYGLEERVFVDAESFYNNTRGYFTKFEGVIPGLKRRLAEAASERVKLKLEQYIVSQPCAECKGTRLKPQVTAVKIAGYSILEFTSVPIDTCLGMLDTLTLSERQARIAHEVLREIRARLQFLVDVGLEYLTLDRSANTLSGGEAQRIRLATQIGSGLTGVLYVLDEPSIGLHQRDNERLLRTLFRLRSLDNTLLVVEHDEDTMRAADHLIDIGPGAGVHGGRVVAQGTVEDIVLCPESITGAYLSGRRRIETPAVRRCGNGLRLSIRGASRNNLRSVAVEIPLGKFVCVTGVSGSGKSTLINEILYPYLKHHFGRTSPRPHGVEAVEGVAHLDKVIVIDQSPIGRTPRSNPATYTGAFDAIREIFSMTIEAKARGYEPGRFSFNVKGGRCEACKGEGVNVIAMNFLPDVYVQCDVCKGKRYNRETLQVKYKNKTIADVLEMTVEEACQFFENIPKAINKLETLRQVGLDYIRLGQPAPTLSGGEAQRIKLATELSRRSTGKTLYLLDEPSTGLSFYDVHKLLDVLVKLVDTGNTVVVIEHNLDILRVCDWIIDLGPEGGRKGGQIVATGTPEQVAAVEASYTGQFLRRVLEPAPRMLVGSEAAQQ